MNKGIKILLTTLISIIIIIIFYVILVINEIVPNPLLDTKDMICVRDSSNVSLDDKIEDEKIFKFDSKAIIKSYEEKTIYTFTSEEYAKQQYDFAIAETQDEVYLDKNVLTISRTFVMKKNEGYYGKTKEEIRKIYGEEFGYECK